jgi:hypothetical protein
MKKHEKYQTLFELNQTGHEIEVARGNVQVYDINGNHISQSLASTRILQNEIIYIMKDPTIFKFLRHEAGMMKVTEEGVLEAGVRLEFTNGDNLYADMFHNLHKGQGKDKYRMTRRQHLNKLMKHLHNDPFWQCSPSKWYEEMSVFKRRLFQFDVNELEKADSSVRMDSYRIQYFYKTEPPLINLLPEEIESALRRASSETYQMRPKRASDFLKEERLKAQMKKTGKTPKPNGHDMDPKQLYDSFRDDLPF